MIDPGKLRPIDVNRPWYNKALDLLPSSPQKILELGAGAGEFADRLKTLGYKVICVEGSPVYLKRLKKMGFSTKKADLNKSLPLPAGTFDGVLSLEVIEHLIEVDKFLSEVYRVLKPKGWLIISTPNIAWWGYRLFALMGQPPKKEGYHLRFFTHNTLTQLLKKHGFRIKGSNSFTTVPFINRYLSFRFYPTVKHWPNLLAQDLVFLCRK